MPEKNGDQPATKSDLAAVKSDLAAVRTELKSDVAAVKSDLAAFRTKVATEFIQTNARIDRLDHSLNEKIDKTAERILSAVDSFSRKAVAYDRKALSHGAILQDHEDTLKGHGKRIAALESKR